MGNWTIVIEGTGSHHNNLDPSDADVMAMRFIQALEENGHHVEHASITTAGRDVFRSHNVQPPKAK